MLLLLPYVIHAYMHDPSSLYEVTIPPSTEVETYLFRQAFGTALS